MGEKLSPGDQRILAFLDDNGGFLAKQIALEVFGDGEFPSTKPMIARARESLARMLKLGLVERLDLETPYAYRRTKAGRAALQQEGERK